ncbi:dehydrogenase with different specificitie [Lentithecium fluviatile CBS 122367]|uniref:Dehydrogenase with different specificitie n=1 Tax=Lentithecium fluviatile CBS 122367 TaxID=1168545 RepID=A0A6G1IUT2_9PLEO|nr:dehydrogenase with different specificitie [Lentithecium fluviatile CBS 122367]
MAAKKTSYDPERDIPSLKDKVIFITGGTAGLGTQTILTLAQHNPSQIHFTGRNAHSAQTILSTLRTLAPAVQTHFYECDQTSLASVDSAASSFLSKNPSRLDVLVCNAGIMGGPAGVTKDGYEIQFGINFLSHALLTKRFLPLLERTAADHGEARIVNTSSVGYTMHTTSLPFDKLKTPLEDIPSILSIGAWQKWSRYAQSKFAQVIYTAELAKRYPSITSIAINPGVVHTGLVENLPLWDRLFVKTWTFGQAVPLEQGAYNSCWAATAGIEGMGNGGMYNPVGVVTKHTDAASDEGLWRELWEWTEGELADWMTEQSGRDLGGSLKV